MTPPLIGLTGRRKTADQIVGTPEVLHHLEGDWFYADYARGVLAAGGLPVHLPLDADPAAYAGRLDGVLLTGGADLAPSMYDAAPETDAFPPEPERDRFEADLFHAASDARLPVLGICRGLQMVNVACGGSLHQDIPVHAGFDVAPTTLLHSVDVEAGSTLAGIYGERLEVNSLHHQTVDRLGDSLTVTARADDGTVEGLEHTDLPIVAVQWHPEMLTTRDSDPIFRWLVDTASS